MSYICDCCNRVFDEPTPHSEYRETLSHGFYVYEEVLGCPFCGGPFEEVPSAHCAICGEAIDDGELCEDCMERLDYQIGEILDDLPSAARKFYCEEADKLKLYLMGCWRTYRQREAEKE